MADSYNGEAVSAQIVIKNNLKPSLKPGVYIAPFSELYVETPTGTFLIIVDPNDVARQIYTAKKANPNTEIQCDKLDNGFADVVGQMRKKQSAMTRSYDFWMKDYYGIVKYSEDEGSNPEKKDTRVSLALESPEYLSFNGEMPPIDGMLRKKDTYDVRFIVWPYEA